MKVSDYIIRVLHAQGISHVFELSGGMITHLLDSVNRLGLVEAVSVRHEQAAAFAADAFGRLTGVPGVAMATSGPGATNLLTGIGSCYFDSSPAVFITGQVNLDEQKGDRGIRQLGFQETDIVSMAQPITKAAFSVRAPEEVPGILRHAFSLATEGRPGPVLVDIPMGIQRAEIALSGNLEFSSCRQTRDFSAEAEDLHRALARAERPLILAGGGIRAAGAQQLFRALLERWRIPVVNSLMGVDLLPHSHPCRVGMIGSYGNRWANLALSRSDLLIVLGSRLD
ncbi:MAG: thiamine pyrophosphate-binding protein, partial [Acidobacteriaceae bacterium]|nr:thiamine pyrophosphate-binding protein [Acidobacteriaceae bacterium]